MQLLNGVYVPTSICFFAPLHLGRTTGRATSEERIGRAVSWSMPRQILEVAGWADTRNRPRPASFGLGVPTRSVMRPTRAIATEDVPAGRPFFAGV